MIHFVAILEDEDERYIENLDSEILLEKFNKCKNLLTVTDDYSNTINIGGYDLHFINFKHLKFGQFIDIEEFITDDYIGNLHLIASCLYLQTENKPLCEPQPEDIAFIDKAHRGRLIQELPAQQVLGACNKYLSFRSRFFESYSVFSDPDDVNIDELDEEERKLYEEEKKELEKGRKDQWFKMLNILTNEDATKFNDYLNMNVHIVFNQFTMLNSKMNKK